MQIPGMMKRPRVLGAAGLGLWYPTSRQKRARYGAHPAFVVRSGRNGTSGFESSSAMGKAPVGPDVVTGVAVWISFQIVLMFGLSLPKGTGRFYRRHHFSRPDS